MRYRLITPPTLNPVTVEEAKLHCRIDGAAEDDLVFAYITAATQLAEQITGRSIMTQTWRVSMDRWVKSFELLHPPFQSFYRFTYTAYTADPTSPEYDTEPGLNPPDQMVAGLDDQSIPTVHLLNFDDPASIWQRYKDDTQAVPDAVKWDYITGWPDAASVPESIKSWVKLMVGTMYANRESHAKDQVYSLGFADSLLDRYKLWSF